VGYVCIYSLQTYDDTEEGRKVCTYYKLTNMPTVLILDPVTGQKMRAWEGMIGAERLLEVRGKGSWVIGHKALYLTNVC
jgi:hypothetical protein